MKFTPIKKYKSISRKPNKAQMEFGHAPLTRPYDGASWANSREDMVERKIRKNKK